MLIKRFNRVLPVLLVLSFFVTLLHLSVLLSFLLLLRWVVPSNDPSGIPLVMLLTAGLLLAMVLFDTVRFYALRRFATSLNATLGEPILARLVRDTGTESGADARAAMTDLKLVRQFLVSPTATALLDSIMIPLKLLVLMLISVPLGVLALLCVLLIVVLKLVRLRALREQLEQSRQGSERAKTLADEAVEQAQTVQAMGMGSNLLRHWRSAQGEALRRQTSMSETLAADVAAFASLGMIMQVAMMGVGFGLVISGAMDGSFVILAVLLAARVIFPLQALLNNWQDFVEAREALRRLNTIADALVSDTEERLDLPAPEGALQAQGLIYRRGDAMLLKGISFVLMPGQVMGVIGPSGAGKSTLARLLAGAEPCSGGLLRLDGADMAKWDRDRLGQYVGFLPQEVELFAGTVAENIARCSTTPDLAQVRTVAEQAGLSEESPHLPEGFETLLTDGGGNLPGGICQRIGLARALYGQPRLLVMDEPDAYLDKPGRQALRKILEEAPSRGMTVVLVTHTPALWTLTHALLLIRHGATVEFGPTRRVLKTLQQSAKPGQLPRDKPALIKSEPAPQAAS